MAKMGGKLKPDQLLQLGLAHIEKAVLAGVGLFMAFVLIYEPMGDSGKWSAFKTHPNEFQAKIDAARSSHQNARWTSSEEKKKFEELADVRVAVGSRKSQLDVSRFEYATPFHFSPYEKKQKDSVPILLPIQDVLADAGQAIMRPTPTDDDEEEDDPKVAGNEKVAGKIVGQDGRPQIARPRSSVAPRKNRQKGGGFNAGGGGGGGGFQAGGPRGGGGPMGGGGFQA